MSVIDRTYFTNKPTLLPQLEAVATGIAPAIKTSRNNEVDNYISIYEPLFLENLLGYELAQEFIEGIAEDKPEDKWVDMKNMLVNETKKLSPIAFYIYYHVINDMQLDIASVGGVQNKADNASMMSVRSKMNRVWNLMTEWNIRFYEWLMDNESTYEHDEVYIKYNYILCEQDIYGL
jgi:hypothetical protein